MIINITQSPELDLDFIWRNILCPARAPEHPRHEARPVTVNCPICKIYRSKSYQAKTNERVILYYTSEVRLNILSSYLQKVSLKL